MPQAQENLSKHFLTLEYFSLQSVTKMVDRIRKVQILHNQILVHQYLKNNSELYLPLQSVTKMVDRIRKFQILHNQIYSVLNKYLKPMETDQETFLLVKEIDPPPPDPEMAKNVKPLEEGKGQTEEKEQESLTGEEDLG